MTNSNKQILKIENFDKKQLDHLFSKASKTYDEWASPQNESAKYLISLIEPDTLEGKILDAGCGTGLLTRSLLERNSNLDIDGVDISRTMLTQYKTINPNVIHGDLENIPLASQSYQHIVSNFTLHWTDLTKTLAELSRVTKEHLYVAFPVKGSLFGLSFPFPDKNDVLLLLKSLGLKLTHAEVRQIKIPFQGLDLIKYFHFTGTSYTEKRRKGLMRKDHFTKWINEYEKTDFSYNVLFIIAT